MNQKKDVEDLKKDIGNDFNMQAHNIGTNKNDLTNMHNDIAKYVHRMKEDHSNQIKDLDARFGNSFTELQSQTRVAIQEIQAAINVTKHGTATAGAASHPTTSHILATMPSTTYPTSAHTHNHPILVYPDGLRISSNKSCICLSDVFGPILDGGICLSNVFGPILDANGLTFVCLSDVFGPFLDANGLIFDGDGCIINADGLKFRNDGPHNVLRNELSPTDDFAQSPCFIAIPNGGECTISYAMGGSERGCRIIQAALLSQMEILSGTGNTEPFCWFAP